MQGVAPAWPGIGVRHAMFSDLVHLVGMFFSVEIPSLFAPRHCGQFSALAVDARRIAIERKERIKRMGVVS